MKANHSRGLHDATGLQLAWAMWSDPLLLCPAGTGPKDPSQRPQHISLYIGIGVSAGIICLGCVLAWVLIRRFRRRAALETQPPTWRMPGALPGVQAAYGSEAQRRFPTDDKV
jgi:hypothetical protein